MSSILTIQPSNNWGFTYTGRVTLATVFIRNYRHRCQFFKSKIRKAEGTTCDLRILNDAPGEDMSRFSPFFSVLAIYFSSQAFAGKVTLSSKVKSTNNGKITTYYAPVTYNAKTKVYTGSVALQLTEAAPVTIKPKTRCFNFTQVSGHYGYIASTKTPRVCFARNGIVGFTVVTNGPQIAEIQLEEESPTAEKVALNARIHFYLKGINTLGIGFPNDVATSGLGILLKQDQCIPMTVIGGIPPYHLSVSSSEIAYINEDTAVCGKSKSGTFTVSAYDETPRKPLTTTYTFANVQPMTQASLDPKSWQKIYWKDANGNRLPISNPNSHPAGGVTFDFPAINQGVAGYFTYLAGFTYVQGKSLRARFAIETEGPVEFDYKTEPENTCDFPAHGRFYIQDHRGISPNELGRWWSNPLAIKLEQGESDLEVPLEPIEWTSVYGKRGDFSPETIKKFRDVLSNPAEIGFTFGGGCFFGHGVRTVNGKARFILRSMELVPATE